MSRPHRKPTASAKHRRPAASANDRRPTASAIEVAGIAVTGAGFQGADHGGSGGRCACARAGHPLGALPTEAQHIIRAGVLAFALGLGAAVAKTPAVAFAAPDDTSSAGRRLIRRRRPARHLNPRQMLHHRMRHHRQLRRSQRMAPRQVRGRHRMRRNMIRIQHRMPRAAPHRSAPDQRARHPRTSQRGSSAQPRRPLNRSPRQTHRWSQLPASLRPRRVLRSRKRLQWRLVTRHRRTPSPMSRQRCWHR